MTKVILIAQDLDDGVIARNLAIFPEPREVTLLTDSRASWPFTTISIGTQPLESLKVAALESTSERILLLDAAIAPSPKDLTKMLEQTNCEGSICYFPVNYANSTAQLEAASAKSILEQISSGRAWPTGALLVETNAINEINDGCSLSLRELLAQFLVDKIAENCTVTRSNFTVHASSELALEHSKLSDCERARLLAFILDRFNIEEIFPEHNWQEFEAESAAACYHAFAALFIKLGDAESANSCLQLSENFEDSPRSLALRAIIARERGEILGAVANMVSSLQQYELRKKSDGTHYLNFKPNNIEVISERLKSGLAALNKRNNESALEHFTAAVLNFDNFYQDLGVDKIATKALAV